MYYMYIHRWYNYLTRINANAGKWKSQKVLARGRRTRSREIIEATNLDDDDDGDDALQRAAALRDKASADTGQDKGRLQPRPRPRTNDDDGDDAPDDGDDDESRSPRRPCSSISSRCCSPMARCICRTRHPTINDPWSPKRRYQDPSVSIVWYTGPPSGWWHGVCCHRSRQAVCCLSRGTGPRSCWHNHGWLAAAARCRTAWCPAVQAPLFATWPHLARVGHLRTHPLIGSPRRTVAAAVVDGAVAAVAAADLHRVRSRYSLSVNNVERSISFW